MTLKKGYVKSTREGFRLRVYVWELPYLAGIEDLGGEREQGCGIRKETEFPEGKVGFIQLIK